MNRLTSYILVAMVVLTAALIIMAHLMEEKIHDQYGRDFNDFRKEKGIVTLNKFDHKSHVYWKDFVPGHPWRKWLWILSNDEIGTETMHFNDSIPDQPYHYSKTIFYGTHLLFWQNFYAGEIDHFLNPISKDTLLELKRVYYSAALDPGDYFYANIDTLYPGKPDIFLCGTPFLEDENYVTKGNISKAEADKILEIWKINSQY